MEPNPDPGLARKEFAMRFFTKMMAATAVVVGLGFAGSATANAAHPPQVVVNPSFAPYPFPYPYPFPGPFPFPRVDYDYVVFYKPSIFAPWQVYGKFETLHKAQITALRLQQFGTATRIERVRGFGW